MNCLKIIFTGATIWISCGLFAQKQIKAFQYIDTNAFADASHHWYGIFDKHNTIQPKPNQPKYHANELAAIADNILLYQKNNGGWPKNYDIQAILTKAQKDSLINAKGDLTTTTYDNGTTYTHIVALAKVFYVTQKEKYKAAILKGLNFILASQYENGGWPQYYPLQNNYSKHITFNDDAMGGILWLLKDINENKIQYKFIDGQLKKQLQLAYNKGLDCILKTQINDAGKPTAWCQQYDAVTLQPAWARAFEPPSICNGESVDLVLLLMSIKHPSKEIIDAVQYAVTWFKESKILYTRVKTISAEKLVTPYKTTHEDKVVVIDSSAPPIWTRYYELKTHRPLFCNRDSKVVYSLAEVDRERRDGYGWYTYGPQKVLNKYLEWKKILEK